MPFRNRVRLPFILKHPQYQDETTVHTKANGVSKILSSVTEKVFIGGSDYMPDRMHARLSFALKHDTVSIEGDWYLGDVTYRPGSYEISWIEWMDHILGQAKFQIKVTPYDFTNSNCQTCDEASQLLLDDDDMGEILEGTTDDINVYTNDNIFCFPFTAEIVSYNATYLDDMTIDETTGLVTVVVKDPIGSTGPIILGTYRVTCANGNFDEADIIGRVTGSLEECQPPSNLDYTFIPETELSVESHQISFDASPSSPGEYEWQVFECGNLGSPIQTGTETTSPIIILGLEPGGCYVVSIRSDCGDGNFSEYESLEFNTPSPETMCGRFRVTANDGSFNRNSYNFSYYDCAGVLQNSIVLNLGTRFVCMLMDEDNDPIYFSADPEVTTPLYIEPCA